MVKQRILITGGLGFIGRCLLKHLQKQIDDIEYIQVVDNLSNSSIYPDIRSQKVFLDICDVESFSTHLPFTHIYHLASPVGPAGVLKYAGKMARMVVSDTIKMAELAIHNRAKMIDISTSEVYGCDPGDVPQIEDIDKIVPAKTTVRLEYGVAKLASEIALLNLCKTTSLQVNIIRPFNIVGVGQQGEVGFVLPRFMEAALKNCPLQVFGDGTQKRCFTSVDDIVDALLLTMDTQTRGQIFNVGNPANVCSIYHLAEMVIECTDSQSRIELVDPKQIFGPLYEEAWNKIPDITKISTVLGWSPKKDLQTIINEVRNSYLQ